MHNHGDNSVFQQIPTHQEMARDVLGRYREISPRYWSWIAVFSLLFLLGVVGFVMRLAGGFDDRKIWAYHVATLSFLLGTFMAMPLVSAGFRLTKNHWRRPLSRLTEHFALSGIIGLLMLFPALAALPPLEGRFDIWFDWPLLAPSGWNIMAFAGLLLMGIAFLWALALPDLAAARDHLPPSRRQSLVSALSLGWTGHLRQWRVHRMSIMILGVFYALFYPLVQTLMVADFHGGLLPGWRDHILPASQFLGGAQAAVGLTLVCMYLMRRLGGYERYFGIDQFWALSKPLLAMSLLFAYFWWASFITFWYGRMPGESEVMRLTMIETYRVSLMLALFLNFLGPLLALMWNPVRKSVWGPALVGAGVIVGAFINQIRLYVAPFTVEDVSAHVIEPLPPTLWPALPDLLIMIGAISGVILLFLISTKIIPVISIWEVGEGLRLIKVRQFLRRQVRVMAKLP